MDLISEIVERAKANKQRIVLPEGTEERTLKAANQILTDGVADLILLGNPDEIMNLAKEWGLGNIHKATIIDPEIILNKKNMHSCCANFVRKRYDHRRSSQTCAESFVLGLSDYQGW